MNKLLYATLVVATTLGFTACSSDEPANVTGDGTGNITLVANLPAELATRAYSDGTTATQLKYYVYQQGQNVPVIKEENATINLSTTVSLNLVNGMTYDIVFWAQSPDTEAYTYNATDRTITVNYEGITQNDEDRDAFYCVKTVTVTGGTTENAELVRPFAQVNFGTSDWQEASVKNIFGENLASLSTELTVTTALPNVLNLMSGAVSGTQKVIFGKAGVPSDETFPAGGASANPIFAGCKYVAMDYVLCGKKRSVIDVNMDIYAGETKMSALNVPNVPVQANYQTNIFGKLLSSAQDFNVVINPSFDGTIDNISVWDGSVKEPVTDDNAKTVTIATGSELAGFAKNVNDGNDYRGYTVTLTDDIDLNGIEWTPIGPNSDASNKFRGVFDGGNHTISNLKVSKSDVDESAGLFGSLNGTVRNVKIDNASISLKSSGDNSDNGAGFIAGAIYNTGLIENCEVSNSVLQSNRYGGGIVGYSYGSANNNKVTDCQISARLGSDLTVNDKVGGIVGYSGEGNGKYIGNVVTGCSLLGSRNIGGIAGCTQSGNLIKDNIVSNTTVNWTSALGNSNANSGSYSNGPIVGRVIGSTLTDNISDNVTVEKQK